MGRPLGSKNKNPYPKSEKVIERCKIGGERLKSLGSQWKGRKHSEETKKRMSETRKGRSVSEETKQRMRLWTGEKNHFFGKSHSEETKRRLSEVQKADYKSGKRVHPRGMLGKVLTDEQKENHRQGALNALEKFGFKHMVRNSMKGYFKPVNKIKYKGNVNNIIFRSSWEMKYFLDLDHNPDVIEWSSEEIIVPYTSPLDLGYHRYYPDVWVKKKDGTCYLIEIKPSSQCRPPKREGKLSKKYLREAKQFALNQAKFEAADRYCKKRGWTFQVLTERELKVF